jgi:hypothetical protein
MLSGATSRSELREYPCLKNLNNVSEIIDAVDKRPMKDAYDELDRSAIN